MAEKTTLTREICDGVAVPEAGLVELIDAQQPGLRYRVTRAGHRTWQYYRSHRGKPVRRLLGDYGDMSPAAARREARAVAAELDGEAPVTAQVIDHAGTVGDLYARWRAMCVAHGKKTLREDDKRWRGYLSALANLPVSIVTRAHVREIHMQIGKTSPYQANRVVALIRAVWNWAIDEDLAPSPNPAGRIRMFKERSRERFAEPAELAAIAEALASGKVEDYMRDFVELALCTGQRKSNILAMRWRDVNLDRGTWTVSGEETKNGDPFLVALLPQAVEALKRRRQAVGGSPWVFPGRFRGTDHLRDVKGSWRRVLTLAGVEDLRIHDLRRTLGSYMAMNGESLVAIGRALGHKSTQATQVYARLQLQSVRDGMGGAVDRMGI